MAWMPGSDLHLCLSFGKKDKPNFGEKDLSTIKLNQLQKNKTRRSPGSEPSIKIMVLGTTDGGGAVGFDAKVRRYT